MAKVSIVVPIYNVEKYLKKCLDSILNQTFNDFEIILVNDGSTDNSGTICDKYKLIDQRIKVIHTLNQGSGEARNTGMDTAKGEYIYFCDPDDWIEVDLIEENYKLAKKNNADIIIFGINNYMFDTKKNNYRFTGRREVGYSHLSFRKEFPKLYKKGLASAVWNKLYKVSYLKQQNCRFPNYSKGQDWSFNLFVYREVENVVYNNKYFYNYVKYESNTAVTRYNKDIPYIRKRLFEEFKSLLDYWNYLNVDEEIYNELLYKCLLVEVLGELRNNFHFDSPDSISGKYKKCKKTLHDQQIVQTIGNLKSVKETINEKIMVTFIRKKFVIGIMIESYLRQVIRSKLKGIVYDTKKYIRKR